MKCRKCHWLLEWRGQYFCYMDFYRNVLKVVRCEDYITRKQMKARYPWMR